MVFVRVVLVVVFLVFFVIVVVVIVIIPSKRLDDLDIPRSLNAGDGTTYRQTLRLIDWPGQEAS